MTSSLKKITALALATAMLSTISAYAAASSEPIDDGAPKTKAVTAPVTPVPVGQVPVAQEKVYATCCGFTLPWTKAKVAQVLHITDEGIQFVMKDGNIILQGLTAAHLGNPDVMNNVAGIFSAVSTISANASAAAGTGVDLSTVGMDIGTGVATTVASTTSGPTSSQAAAAAKIIAALNKSSK